MPLLTTHSQLTNMSIFNPLTCAEPVQQQRTLVQEVEAGVQVFHHVLAIPGQVEHVRLQAVSGAVMR